MSRTKGAKNKPKVSAAVVPVFAEEKGNPAFNITDVEPTNVLQAQSTMTDEDLELDRRLDNMEKSAPPSNIELGPPDATKEKIIYSLLSEVMDVKPASTKRELDDQIWMAKEKGCDSIEATGDMVRSFDRKNFPPTCGFIMCSGIRVFQEGRVEEAIGLDKRTTREFDVKGPISARGAHSV